MQKATLGLRHFSDLNWKIWICGSSQNLLKYPSQNSDTWVRQSENQTVLLGSCVVKKKKNNAQHRFNDSNIRVYVAEWN